MLEKSKKKTETFRDITKMMRNFVRIHSKFLSSLMRFLYFY